MNEDKYRDVTMTALPLFRVPFLQSWSAKQWWIVFILDVPCAQWTCDVVPRGHHSRVPPEQHAVALTCHPRQWGSIPQFRNYLRVKFGIKFWSLLFHHCVLKLGGGQFFGCDWWPEATRTWTLDGNRKWIWNWFRRRFVFSTNFFLGRIRV